MSQARAARPIAPICDGAEPRIAAGDWERIERDLDGRGFAVIDRLLAPEECEALAGLYGDDGLFRKHVIMAQHGYGRGDYKYFAYPLPASDRRLADGGLSASGRSSPTAGTRR